MSIAIINPVSSGSAVGAVKSVAAATQRVEYYTCGSQTVGCMILSTSDVGAVGSSPGTGKGLITFGTPFSAPPTVIVTVAYTGGGVNFVGIIDYATGVPTATHVNIASISFLGAYANVDGFTIIAMGPK